MSHRPELRPGRRERRAARHEPAPGGARRPQTIVASARELLDAEYAALGVPDDHGGFAQFVVDGVSDEQWKAIGPLPRQHGILAAMLHEASPERLADVRKDPRFEGWPAAHPEMADFLGMPIADGDEILGALFLANKRCAPGRRAAAAASPRRTRSCCALLAQHAAIALTNARLYERSRELTIAEERARIAHELHDAVAQKLFSLRLTAQAAAALVDRDPARAKGELHEVAALAAEAADELRAAVVELRPAALDEDGLVATLRTQVQVLDRAHSARVTFDVPRAYARCPPPRRRRCCASPRRPCTTRCATPAPTPSTSPSSGAAQGAVLRVTDDGSGFDPQAVRQAGRHLGLVSMRDRASGVGGRLTVESAPGKGTADRDGGARWLTPIRVLLVDDHQVVRRGLRTFLEIQDDIEVVGEAADGAEGVARAEELRPDVVLMDVKMPGTDGIEALRGLRELDNPARVLVVTSFTEQRTVVPALRAGAAGYVYKDIDPDALAGAIRSVHAGPRAAPAGGRRRAARPDDPGGGTGRGSTR